MLPIPIPPALAGERHFACEAGYLPPAARALLDLGHDQCRWPLGEPSAADFAFCPGCRLGRSRYCAAHARQARGGARP